MLDGDLCESTAPTPVSEASTSTMNCKAGSGWMRTGAELNGSLSSPSGISASGVQRKGMEVEVRAVSNAAVVED